MEPIIKVKNITYRYPKVDFDAVKRITTDIYENQYIAILGPNGSGKSTLARLLNGLLLPTEGVVIVDQIETTDSNDHIWHIRKQVGIVFQNPDNQIVATTVEEDVAFGLENQGIESDKIRERVNEVLTKIGIFSLKLIEPHYLSGGQKQKVAIAGILAMKPKVIIFDEATSMLDPKGRKDVLKIAKKLVEEEEKITLIHITHFLQEAILADRVIIMNEGKVFLDGIPKEVFKERDLLKGIGLEVPLEVELTHRLREKGYPLNENILNQEEFVQGLWTLV